MGNRASIAQQPGAPPPLLSAAVMGDWEKFQSAWKEEDKRLATDSQQNNCLHALFSCRVPDAKCDDILKRIHEDLPAAQIADLYGSRNNLGCTPLWILIAYGNVPLLKQVQDAIENNSDASLNVAEMMLVPNHQGDSPLLATCSQGNTEMVQYLKDHHMTTEQFTDLLFQGNEKGTTPLQIVIGNGHLTLLQYLLKETGCFSSKEQRQQLLQTNAAGLSLFHICSERNFYTGLQVLLEHMIATKKSSDGDNGNSNASAFEALEEVLAVKDKNKANALHVAGFCGNEEAVQEWVNIVETATSKLEKSEERKVDLLDKMDGQARTAYWLAMVQGHETIGKILAAEGVDTKHPKMVQEIEEALQRRMEKQKQKQKQ